jgi:squalene synthase HpnC
MAWNFAEQLRRFGPESRAERPELERARSYCAWLARNHYENFTVASVLLPRKLLPPFYSVYAYCRWADDLADETTGGPEAIRLLRWWREELLACYEGRTRHPVMVALRPTIERYRIPPEPFLNLLTAFEQDQTVKEYDTFEQLLDYCAYSANPVGRLVLYLFECASPEASRLSDFICTGLQLANFWQDVRRDYLDLGRIYLPREERNRFGCTDESLTRGQFTPAFRALMKHLVQVTRDLFERGRPLLDLVPSEARIDIRLFMDGGLATLRKIERRDYDVLTERAKLSKAEKASLLLRAVGGMIANRLVGTLARGSG